MITEWPEFESPLLKRIISAFSARRKATSDLSNIHCEGEALIPEEWLRVFWLRPSVPSIELVIHNQGNAYLHLRRTTKECYEQLIIEVDELRLRPGADEFQNPLSDKVVETFEWTMGQASEAQGHFGKEHGRMYEQAIKKRWREISS